MQNTLEDLYYGSIMPYDTQSVPGSNLEKALSHAAECEKHLTNRLAGTEQALLLDLINAYDEITGTLALEKFILGFRLGMRLAVESFADDANPKAQHKTGGNSHA